MHGDYTMCWSYYVANTGDYLFTVGTFTESARACSYFFKSGGAENLSVLAVNVLAVNRPLSLLYTTVSKSVFCTLNSVRSV